MRVVITHTDFRIYWPARIQALRRALESRGDELYVIEIAGEGSPYAFSRSAGPGGAAGPGGRGAAAGSGGAGPVVLSGAAGFVPGPPGPVGLPGVAGPGAERPAGWTCLFPTARMEDIPPARASKALLSKLEALDPDVVMGGSIAYPSGAMAVYWAKHHQKPVIIFDDARPQDVPRNPLVNYIKRLIYRQVDAVLCPASPWTKGFIDWNFQPTQVFYGVDVVDNDFWETRESGEIPPDLPSPYLLAVGRQIAVKNFVHLLEVYEQYQKKVAPQDRLPLVLVGDGPERKIIEAFIRDKRLEQVFLIPFVSQKQLRILYHHAAALVLPSRSDTWGLVVNEAMAAGLPVLVSNACGCAPVLVHEGINGYTFPPDKPEELLAVLLSFAQMTAAEKAAMGMASRRIIRPWGLDQFVKGSLQAIDHAVANRKICRSIPARLVLRHWKGRYRPV